MDELAGLGEIRITGQFFFHPVFDRLDVMVDARFNLFDAPGVGFGEVGHHLVQIGLHAVGKRRQFLEAGAPKRLEPRHFDKYPVV